jgi:hypothetical protein
MAMLVLWLGIFEDDAFDDMATLSGYPVPTPTACTEFHTFNG